MRVARLAVCRTHDCVVASLVCVAPLSFHWTVNDEASLTTKEALASVNIQGQWVPVTTVVDLNAPGRFVITVTASDTRGHFGKVRDCCCAPVAVLAHGSRVCFARLTLPFTWLASPSHLNSRRPVLSAQRVTPLCVSVVCLPAACLKCRRTLLATASASVACLCSLSRAWSRPPHRQQRRSLSRGLSAPAWLSAQATAWSSPQRCCSLRQQVVLLMAVTLRSSTRPEAPPPWSWATPGTSRPGLAARRHAEPAKTRALWCAKTQPPTRRWTTWCAWHLARPSPRLPAAAWSPPVCLRSGVSASGRPALPRLAAPHPPPPGRWSA